MAYELIQVARAAENLSQLWVNFLMALASVISLQAPLLFKEMSHKDMGRAAFLCSVSARLCAGSQDQGTADETVVQTCTTGCCHCLTHLKQDGCQM